MAINAEWHTNNPMPKNPTENQRIAWHLEHVQFCSCRKIPGKLRAVMDKAGITYPADKAE